MDATAISNLLLGAGGIIGFIGTYLSAAQKRARARSKQLAKDLETANEYISSSRRNLRVHNELLHPSGDGAIDVPGLPEYWVRDEE